MYKTSFTIDNSTFLNGVIHNGFINGVAYIENN